MQQRTIPAILTRPIASIHSEAEKLEYKIAFVLDFLAQQFDELQLLGGHEDLIYAQLVKSRRMIVTAKHFADIDVALNGLHTIIEAWKPSFIEKSRYKKLTNIAWQIKILTTTIYNFEYYAKYQLLIHPAADPRPPKTVNATYSHYLNGLPSTLIREIQEDPQFCILYVSGVYPFNPWGHAILFLGKAGALHINSPKGYPKFMSLLELVLYLIAENKRILGMQRIGVKHVNDAILEIIKVAKETWKWFGVKHNCVTFCKQILRAGGENLHSRTEYKGVFFALPTTYLELANHTELHLDLPKKVYEIGLFNPRIFYTHLISQLDILSNFSASEVIKFFKYIIVNIDKVLLAQIDLIVEHADSVRGMNTTERETFTNKIVPSVCLLIRKKLNDIYQDVLQRYHPLFRAGQLKELKIEHELIDQAIEYAQRTLPLKRFAQADEITPSMNINQDEESSLSC